jgi:hypothetical protein
MRTCKLWRQIGLYLVDHSCSLVLSVERPDSMTRKHLTQYTNVVPDMDERLLVHEISSQTNCNFVILEPSRNALVGSARTRGNDVLTAVEPSSPRAGTKNTARNHRLVSHLPRFTFYCVRGRDRTPDFCHTLTPQYGFLGRAGVVIRALILPFARLERKSGQN